MDAARGAGCLEDITMDMAGMWLLLSAICATQRLPVECVIADTCIASGRGRQPPQCAREGLVIYHGNSLLVLRSEPWTWIAIQGSVGFNSTNARRSLPGRCAGRSCPKGLRHSESMGADVQDARYCSSAEMSGNCCVCPAGLSVAGCAQVLRRDGWRLMGIAGSILDQSFLELPGMRLNQST